MDCSSPGLPVHHQLPELAQTHVHQVGDAINLPWSVGLKLNIQKPKITASTPWKESYDQTRQHIKKQRHYFVNKGPTNQGYGFSSGHVWM